MTAAVKLIPGPIPEGSIIVVTGMVLRGRDDDDPLTAWDGLGEMGQVIEHIAGHRRFAMFYDPGEGADVEVWGPDTDLKAKLTDLLGGREVKPRPERRYLTLFTERPSPMDSAQRRRHCVDARDKTLTLCNLTIAQSVIVDEPFEPHGGIGVVCSACAGQHLDQLRQHSHDDKANPPCGWCHTCGAYLGDDVGACPHCGAVDVEG